MNEEDISKAYKTVFNLMLREQYDYGEIDKETIVELFEFIQKAETLKRKHDSLTNKDGC